MLKLKILIFPLVLLLLAGLVNSATIYGIIYDLSLKKLNNVGVEINTSPKQFVIAQNGSYSFNVPNGDYTIKAQLMQKNDVLASVQENITIKQDGAYVLDLILFPDVEEGVEDIDIDVNGNIAEMNKSKNNILIWLALLVFIIALVSLYYSIKNQKQKKEERNEDDDLEQIIKMLKQEDGRTTQKNIRRQIPLSESKISLMIDELEHKGVIEKIKKGRGNIIILKRTLKN